MSFQIEYNYRARKRDMGIKGVILNGKKIDIGDIDKHNLSRFDGLIRLEDCKFDNGYVVLGVQNA